MATTTTKTNKPILPRGVDNRPVDSYNRAELYSGKALDFDGVGDYIDGGTLDITDYTAISVAMYLNADSVTSTDILFSLRHSGSDDIRFVAELNGLTYAIDDGTLYQFATPIVGGEWYYAVLTFDGSTLKGYLNGQEVDSINASFDFSTANGELNIGRRVNNTLYFDGEISGTKIFNTVLTAAQVADLYNNPEKIVPTGVADSALKLWLPMQEGAGTTAYDGSGNGNHGTISGATYVNGVGAPVSQTAVIDWNKLYDFDGVNDQASNGSYNDTTGTKTYKVHFNSHDVTQQDQQVIQSYVGSTAQNGFGATIAPFGGNSSVFGLRVIFGGTSGAQLSWPVENNTFYELVFTIDWDAQSVSDVTLNGETATGGLGARVANPSGGLYLGSRVNTMYLNGIVNYFEVVGEEKWTNASGFKSESGSYDMTIDGSPTQILAPQGLTSGRDITGVNLFENVRKQGALNLDGNSWAEVHDNASLDITGEVTIEFWCKIPQIETNIPHIIGKRDSIDSNWLRLYKNSSGTMLLEGNGGISIGTPTPDETWTHFVATIDGTSGIIYKNGVSSISGYVPFTMVDSAPLSIGAWIYQNGTLVTPTSLTNGQLAQPRIYNRALTAEEVKRNYEVSARELNQYRLLDRYPNAAAAYSLRLLNTDYTGDAIVVRRASDNQTMSIGFFEDELDTQTLESFCSGTDGFVTTWYDQSGNSHNATTAVASEQPKIVSSGTTITQNGKPCIDFNGNNNGYILSDQNLITSLTDGTQTAISVHSVDDVSVGATNLIYSVVDRNSVRHYFAFGYRSNEARAGYYNDSSWSAKDIAASNNTQYLGFNVTVSDETNFYQNNNQAVSGNEPGLDGNQGLSIGKGTNNNFDLTGTIQEVIFYPNDQTNNRSGMQTNINDFYTIY